MSIKMKTSKLLLILLLFLPVYLFCEDCINISHTGIGVFLTQIIRYSIFFSALFFIIKTVTITDIINIKALLKWLLYILIISAGLKITIEILFILINIIFSLNMISSFIMDVIDLILYILSIFAVFRITFKPQTDIYKSFKASFVNKYGIIIIALVAVYESVEYLFLNYQFSKFTNAGSALDYFILLSSPMGIYKLLPQLLKYLVIAVSVFCIYKTHDFSKKIPSEPVNADELN